MHETPAEVGPLAHSPAGRDPLDPAVNVVMRRETPLHLLIITMSMIIVPLIALCQFIAVYRTDVVDDQMFGYFGWRIANGATVYIDVWDNKPPGIYWINALGFLVGGDTYWGVVAMCVLALTAALACFFGIASTVYYRGAAVSASTHIATTPQ
jgi:hypothetical protein